MVSEDTEAHRWNDASIANPGQSGRELRQRPDRQKKSELVKRRPRLERSGPARRKKRSENRGRSLAASQYYSDGASQA